MPGARTCLAVLCDPMWECNRSWPRATQRPACWLVNGTHSLLPEVNKQEQQGEWRDMFAA